MGALASLFSRQDKDTVDVFIDFESMLLPFRKCPLVFSIKNRTGLEKMQKFIII
jgi:hypothetical protein